MRVFSTFIHVLGAYFNVGALLTVLMSSKHLCHLMTYLLYYFQLQDVTVIDRTVPFSGIR